MRLGDLAYETASALDSNRGRSALTILGIVIGISAVIAMTALINGIKMSLVGELGLNQARLVSVSCWYREMRMDDLNRLAEKLPQYETLTTSTYGWGTVVSSTKTWDADIRGVLPSYFHVMGTELSQGSFFKKRDNDTGAMVAVLDQGAVSKLFGKPDESVVGEKIKIGNDTYTIVGVAVASSAYELQSGTIYIPFSTCAARITGSQYIYDFYGLAREDADMDTIADETKAVLTSYFNIPADEAEESMYVMTMQSVLDELNATMGSFQLMVTAVASISLLVGGIGIMNMMLTNVTERIREIGLRKALGAKRGDITLQFLLEAICLCLVGGVIGCAVGYLGAMGLAAFAGGFLTEMGASEGVKPVLDVQTMLMAAGICVTIGIVFGFYPAWRAARLDPVESLHYQ